MIKQPSAFSRQLSAYGSLVEPDLFSSADLMITEVHETQRWVSPPMSHRLDHQGLGGLASDGLCILQTQLQLHAPN
jgi:hypothetical protein